MNRNIALIFGSLVSFLHIDVVTVLGLATNSNFSDTVQKPGPYLSLIKLDHVLLLGATIVVWIVYVMIVAVLTTIIAIKENLKRMVVQVNA